MVIRSLFILTVMVICLFSCSSEDAKQPEEKTSTGIGVTRYEIAEMEKEMHQSPVLNPVLAANAIEKYTQYAKTYPADSLTPDYLFKAAEIATAIKQYPRAVEFYKKINAEYPSYPLVQESLYLQGYLLDNFMDKFYEAKIVYEEVIRKYPGSSCAADAQAAIDNLGKSDKQLIEEFKKKNKEK